jgi:hypothetical protein
MPSDGGVGGFSHAEMPLSIHLGTTDSKRASLEVRGGFGEGESFESAVGVLVRPGVLVA